MFALYVYNFSTRKYRKVDQSINIAYLGRLCKTRYKKVRCIIRPLGE